MLSLCRVPFQIWKNRIRAGGRRKKITQLFVFAFLFLFALMLFRGAYITFAASSSNYDDEKIVTGLQLGALAFFIMLLFSNFACALAIFFGAQDIPFLLALPISKRGLLFGRGALCLWNASWSTMLFGFPVLAGMLAASNVTAQGIVSCFLGVFLTLFISTAFGIGLATLFVNVVPFSRFVEFFGVLIAVFIICTASIAPELGPHLPSSPARLHLLEQAALREGLAFLGATPPNLLARMTTAASHHGSDWRAVIELLVWSVGTAVFVERIFSALFLRGWGLTFGLLRRQRSVEFRPAVGSSFLGQQVRAFVKKEQKMFLRDPSQAVQLMVILLLTFLYLFNLKGLRSMSFSVEEGTQWWQALLGLANVSLGGCVAAAIATRFVFTSVSLEGRAYPLLRAAPLSIDKFLIAKCVAWFWPVFLITTTLLLAGGFALQLSELSLVYTFIISVSLTIGLVGLGVGMGAVYAHFDWDHSSSLQSSFGSLLFMLLAFVLIFATLLPSGFLFFTANIPNFGADLGPIAQFGPSFLALLVVLVINVIVARGAMSAGNERLSELERA